MSNHQIELINNRHPCKKLQKDWNLLKQHNFDFVILEIGDSFADVVKRLKIQRQYILKVKKNCYNILGLIAIKTTSIISQAKLNQMINSIPVIVNGVEYISISEAARTHGISSSTARSQLNNPNIINWQFKDPSKRVESNVARPVVVNNYFYPSVSVAAVQEGISEKTIRKYIHNNPNWDYYDQLTPIQKKNIINPNDIKGSLGVFVRGRSVKVGTTIYSSIYRAALAHNINQKTVYKRIKSKNFPEWEWGNP